MKQAKFWLNLFNISIGLLIFCATVYVSFSHTLHLFQSVGFTGRKAFAATLAGEALFIMGAVNATVALLYKLKVGTPPWVAFILGLTLTGWANASAHSMYGLIGVLLGLTTPVFMFVAKNVISDTIRKFTRKNDQTGTTNHEQDTDRMTDRMDNRYHDSYQMVGYQNNNQTVDYQNEMVGDYQDSYQPDDHYQHTNQHDTYQMVGYQPDAYQSDSYHTNDQADADSNQAATAYHTTKKATKKTTKKATKKDDHYQTTNQVDNNDQPNDQPDNHYHATNHLVDTYQTTNQPDNQEQTTNQATDRTTNHGHATNQSNDQDTNQMSTATNHDADTEEEIKKAKEVALRILEETGKLPGRLRLEKAAGCSQWAARKALSELKKTG